jgi:hypothetical protein
VLVVAIGFEEGTDEGMAQIVEEEQVGLELADVVGAEGAFAAVGVAVEALGPVDDRGRFAFGASADVLADDSAVDAAGTGVIASAIGAGFPGHEGAGWKWRGRTGRYTTTGGAGRRWPARAPGKYRVQMFPMQQGHRLCPKWYRNGIGWRSRDLVACRPHRILRVSKR